MKQKILVINILLLFVILFLGYLVATTRYAPPQKAKFIKESQTSNKKKESGKETAYGSETSYGIKPPPKKIDGKSPKEIAQAANRYSSFGKSPIFDTIIPKPTPKPTPVRTPKPPPDIKKVTARWKLTSLFGTMASFQDSGSKKDWDMNVGDVKEVKYRNRPCKIKLESVDEDNFKVKVTFGKQEREFSMW
jgi:uncharacterized protein YxeA